MHQPGQIDAGPLQRLEREVPQPSGRQLRVRVTCCGVCRTDLHLAEADLPPKRADITPGHEVVGLVDALGEDASRFEIGDRVGVAWLGATDGSCRFCRRGAENLCRRQHSPAGTGMAVTPTSAWSTRHSRTPSGGIDDETSLPCSAPASSAIAPSARRSRQAARSASMGSAAVLFSPHRSRSLRVCAFMC